MLDLVHSLAGLHEHYFLSAFLNNSGFLPACKTAATLQPNPTPHSDDDQHLPDKVLSSLSRADGALKRFNKTSGFTSLV